jgi:hypothetical protein
MSSLFPHTQPDDAPGRSREPDPPRGAAPADTRWHLRFAGIWSVHDRTALATALDVAEAHTPSSEARDTWLLVCRPSGGRPTYLATHPTASVTLIAFSPDDLAAQIARHATS